MLFHLILSYYFLFFEKGSSVLLNTRYAKQMLWYLGYYVPLGGNACLYCFEPLIFRNSGSCLQTRCSTIRERAARTENEQIFFRVRAGGVEATIPTLEQQKTPNNSDGTNTVFDTCLCQFIYPDFVRLAHAVCSLVSFESWIQQQLPA